MICKPDFDNLQQVCRSQLAASLQFATCSKSAVRNLQQVCSSQFAASLQFATCSNSADRNLQQACWQLAADLLSSSRSKRCERILISAWWSQLAASLQQTCCNLRVSGCVLLQFIHCLLSKFQSNWVSLCFVNARLSSYYCISKYWRTLHVKEYEPRYKIGLKRFCFKLKVYVDKNLVS